MATAVVVALTLLRPTRTAEDHLAAAVWNLLAIMFYQNYDNYASLFDDVPTWNGRKTKWVYDIGVENYDTTKIKSNTTSKKTSN